MHSFLAKSDKQLGLCLRMLFSAGLQGDVKAQMNESRKIEFIVSVDVSDSEFEQLRDRYDLMIS